MAKRESILSNFHEDKLQSDTGGSTGKPKAAHKSEVSSFEPVPNTDRETQKTKGQAASKKKR